MNLQPFLFGDTWVEVKDGNDTVRAIFDRHYSRKRYADGRVPLLFVGPGQKMVLMSPDARAIFAWRKFISGDGQQGINCAIFRNEGREQSSDLIRAADQIADERWPGERHYTYVNPKRVRSFQPWLLLPDGGLAKMRRDQMEPPADIRALAHMTDPGAIDDPSQEDRHAAVARQLARLKLSTAPMQPTTDEARQRAAERQAEHDRLFELTDAVIDRARRLRSLGYPMEAEALERRADDPASDDPH